MNRVTGMDTSALIERAFTSEGMHPYAEVEWDRYDVVIRDWRTGEISFAQYGVEFPASWSENARQIVASKYFRGAMEAPDREWSLKQLIDRVVDTYSHEGRKHGYFLSEEEEIIFNHELKYLLLYQMFSFNSPVWFNVGTSSIQQVSACFLLSVDDSIESILNWYHEEGLIFKGGSGAGVNLSRLRSSREHVSAGGYASGPVSFMRGADASAGTIKSGGRTRRSAKLVCLDVNHPDIREFIECKRKEERKIRALSAAGFDVDLGGSDAYTVQYQNANNSVSVSDAFMRAVEADHQFPLVARTTGEIVETVSARELLTEIAQAAWECADPGIMYDDTINDWHTCPDSGRITTGNPCLEFMHVDNSSCNLASLNLLKFQRPTDFSFDAQKFSQAVALVFTAMDISICFAEFPTPEITRVTRAFRHLGIGYSNLGALLMASGYAYESQEGRDLAAAITSLMQATAYSRSAELAGRVGAYDEFKRNAHSHRAIAARHAKASQRLSDSEVARLASSEWVRARALGNEAGYRNAHLSVLAPTGTISFMMDCDTTGIEPDFALAKTKKTADGSTMSIVNQSVPRALAALGYPNEQIEAIVAYVRQHGHVNDAPGLKGAHYGVFDCAVGKRAISPWGHVRMMAAVQPFISGAISKTINLPKSATADDIADVYLKGWHLGLKALAVYRDGCKSAQPLSTTKTVTEDSAIMEVVSPHDVVPQRMKLPRRRASLTTSFEVGTSQGYLTASSYPDNGIGEIFLKLGKQGSTLAGMMDAFSIAISLGLQHGIPLERFVEKFVGTQFEPRGITNDEDVRMTSSIVDYVFRRLALDYLPAEERAALSILTTAERQALVEGNRGTENRESEPQHASQRASEAPLCPTCGVALVRAGVCYVCESCGSTSGCS
jgi:ribonucleoside-diphosphate reductase alpha chain